ncbi:MAG: holo-[acyl-carrier-protein] synthase [Candidatus Latescibacteria bacterium]|nr:holo-[acyl-carrier-protein] synthase [Candidatus Latescibacterota bacterium]NIO27235.1 holo-[acyl-carrier-protein] synthase [Candidatus Latescibacterota bacterium]NIO54759.1 holo-[acyl-carrier-protein] synthase [Candidatus Latescibacterota bacterium]NIT00842.1 holo-[acyl-carrier-protein] synthase [Candidatus Latescibacterota bacterium]NIT37765.1 holo-[acyl-carrier-protein] synthase [Candidatus Latescibacterota bacterium]
MIKGIGIDTIEISRIDRIFHEYGDRFLAKVFTPWEQEYARRWKAPDARLAARFAAKEACMKALGTGWSRGVRWKDIEIIRGAGGQPELSLHGEAKKRLLELQAEKAHLTITHSREYATAVVILE